MKQRLLTLVIAIFITANPNYAVFADSVNYSDTQAPLVDLVTLSNQKIEVSKLSNKLLIDLTASDDLNNIDWVYVSIYRESLPNPVEVGALGSKYLSSPVSTSIVSNRVISKYQTTFEIPKGFAAGTYYVYAFAKDKAGNYPGLCFEQKYCVYTMSRVRPEALFTVTNDGSGNTIDVTPFDLTSKLSALEKQNLDLATEKTALLNQVSTLGSEKASLQSELLTANRDKASLQSQLASALREKETMQKDINGLNATISNTNKDLLVVQKKLALVCKAKPKPKGC